MKWQDVFLEPEVKERPVVDILPRYCGRSGELLEIVRQDLGFDTQTGKKKYQYWLACPSAEHKDTPYRPGSSYSSRARYVNCEATAWAESLDGFRLLENYVDCTPWPEPVRIEKPKPTRRRAAPKA